MALIDSAASLTGRNTLDDGPPPAPTGAPSRGAGLLPPPGEQQGAGIIGGSPQMMAVQGVALMEQGARLLSAVLPGLSPMVADVVARLRATVPQALAELTQTGSSLPTGNLPAGVQSGGLMAPPPNVLRPHFNLF